MIGFFQNSMAKHHRLVFGVLLVFIVVSFVFYTGSGSVADLLGIRRASVVMGVNLNNREETAPYSLGVALSGGGRVTTAALLQRIFLVKTADAYRIPEPTQDELSGFLSEQGLGADALAAIRREYDVSEDVLRTMIVHSWKVTRFMRTFGNVPAVFESDVDLAWREASARWTVEFAELSPASLSVSVPEPTDEQLSAYYDARKEDFRIAEKVKLSFAKVVPAADAAAKIPEPTDYDLSVFEGEKSADRATRVAAWKKSQALDAAAAELSNTLYEKLPTDAHNPRQDDFAETLAKAGLDFVEIPAFPRDRVPEATGLPAEILASAVSGLNDTLWRTDAIPAGDAVYVVVFRGTEPSRVPALAEVRDAVVSAWKLGEADSRFVAAAKEKGKALTPTNFLEVAKLNGFSVNAPAAFTAYTFRDLPAEYSGVDLIGVLKTVPVGEISPMIRVGEKAVFAKVVAKDVPAPDKNSEEFGRLRTMFDRETSWQTFQMQLLGGLAELQAKQGLLPQVQE